MVASGRPLYHYNMLIYCLVVSVSWNMFRGMHYITSQQFLICRQCVEGQH